RYDQVATARLLATLERPGSGKTAIRDFFRLKVDLAMEPGRPRGCLVTNSATELASRDRGTATKVRAVLAKLEVGFHRAAGRGQKAGDSERAGSARALARFSTCSAQGSRLMATACPEGATREDILTVTRAALD